MRVRPKSRKKTIITAAIILATLVSASLLWYYAFSERSVEEESKGSTQSQREQNKIATEDKENQNTDDTEDTDNKTKDQSVPHEKEKELPQLYEGENTNTSAGLTGVITAKSVAGDNLIIRNTINQMVNGGTCELTLTSSSKTVRKSAEIIQNPSSSACAGFDVPVAELGSGRWNIEIKVSSGDKGMTLKETVNI